MLLTAVMPSTLLYPPTYLPLHDALSRPHVPRHAYKKGHSNAAEESKESIARIAPSVSHAQAESASMPALPNACRTGMVRHESNRGPNVVYPKRRCCADTSIMSHRHTKLVGKLAEHHGNRSKWSYDSS